jgi:hypothetical protein
LWVNMGVLCGRCHPKSFKKNGKKWKGGYYTMKMYASCVFKEV